MFELDDPRITKVGKDLHELALTANWKSYEGTVFANGKTLNLSMETGQTGILNLIAYNFTFIIHFWWIKKKKYIALKTSLVFTERLFLCILCILFTTLS